MARQGDVARVEQGQHVPEQIGLGLFADFVADAVPVERFSHELAAVVVANNLADAISLEQSGEVVDYGRWREPRPHLADSVHDDSFVRPCAPVRNGQRHGVLAAARRVDEGAIGDARSRQHLAIATDATLDHLERDEALDVGAELGEILSRCAGAVLLQRTIDDALRQGWIEGPARTVSHEDERVATCAVVALEHLPQHAASRLRTRGQDQRTTGRRQAGLNCVQDLDIRVGVGCVHIPEGKLVGDYRNIGRAAQFAERRRADLQGNAVGQLQRIRSSARDQLLQDRTAFEGSLCVVEDDLRHSLIERDTEQDTALARHQCIGVVAQTCNVGGECRHCPGLATSSPDHGGELVDTLQRLRLPAGERSECGALVFSEGLAHAGDEQRAPRRPALASQSAAKQVWILQRLAERNARFQSAASCGVRYSDKLGVMFWARRSMPMRCATRTIVDTSSECSWMLISSPCARRLSSCSAKQAAAENRLINCRRVSDNRSAPPWSVAIALAMSRYLRATLVRPSTLANKTGALVRRLFWGSFGRPTLARPGGKPPLNRGISGP